MKIQIALSVLILSSALALGALPATDSVGISPLPTPTPESDLKGKKNVRPDSKSPAPEHASRSAGNVAAGQPVYFYGFLRPGFVYSPVAIEHDEEGRGSITFGKDGFEEQITDPVSLSPVTMDKIKQLISELDFLNSTEEYQHERDFSNLGNVTFTVRKGGKERTVKYNWTANKTAKELMDEYRRIANEYTWLFEFDVARVNQPLRTPGMMDGLDGFFRRNEIPDPPHLVPYLTAISTDEKLPLMARNHALKLIKQIESTKK